MKPDPEAAKALVEKLMKEQPTLVIMGAAVLYALIGRGTAAPAWVKGLPPVGGRMAGPWRGKGSFGRGFGSQMKHR